jgi:hypothetical protein
MLATSLAGEPRKRAEQSITWTEFHYRQNPMNRAHTLAPAPLQTAFKGVVVDHQA